MKLSATVQVAPDAAPAFEARAALLTPVPAEPPQATRGPRPERGRRFEFHVAITFLITALCGFGPSYYLRPVLHAPPLSRVVHVHAALFSGWLLLLVVQSGFIAAHRADLHRRLGVLAVALLGAMIPAGFMTAIEAARASVAAAGKNPAVLLAFQVGALLLFTGFVGAALLQRRRSEHHRRLMLLATVSIIPPAIARLPFVGMRPPLAVALSLLFVLAAIVHDLRTRGRVHPAYAWGGLLLLASIPLRFLVGQTSAWQTFARFLVG